MFIWSGMGILVPVFIFGCSFAVNLITSSLTGSDDYWEQHKWPLGVSLLFAALLCGLLGYYLASRIAKKTGRDAFFEAHHALFFIPMFWWGPILAAIGIIVIIMDLMKT